MVPRRVVEEETSAEAHLEKDVRKEAGSEEGLEGDKDKTASCNEVAEASPSKRYQCPKCPERFDHSTQRNRHQRKEHPEIAFEKGACQIHRCRKQCAKQLITFWELKDHMREEHQNERPITSMKYKRCPMRCLKKYKYFKDRTTHERSGHLLSDPIVIRQS